jgi:hypothetical protein
VAERTRSTRGRRAVAGPPPPGSGPDYAIGGGRRRAHAPWWARDGPPTAWSRASAPGHQPVARPPEPGGPDHGAHVAGPPPPTAWARHGLPAGRLRGSADLQRRRRGGWCGPTRRILPSDTRRRARNVGGASDITGRRGGSAATSRASARESDVSVAPRHRAAPRRPAGGGPASSGESLTPAGSARRQRHEPVVTSTTWPTWFAVMLPSELGQHAHTATATAATTTIASRRRVEEAGPRRSDRSSRRAAGAFGAIDIAPHLPIRSGGQPGAVQPHAPHGAATTSMVVSLSSKLRATRNSATSAAKPWPFWRARGHTCTSRSAATSSRSCRGSSMA